MKQSCYLALGFITGLVLAGCGGDGVVANEDLPTPQDVPTDSGASLDTGGAEDTTPAPEIGDPDTNLPPRTNDCVPGTGCFGEPCEGPDDCLSGICSPHQGDYVCTRTCDATCPEGFSCKLVSAQGGDGQYACVSNFPNLCLPCETAEGCAGDVPGACVRYPDGLSFCGGSCDLETPCPSGFKCQEVDTTTGAKSFQCVNDAGICECSSLAVDSGLGSPCTHENEVGSCKGYRICSSDGLTACDAATPTLESCNGVDDDCDGEVDEGACDDGNACTTDSCAGEAGCTHTPLDAGECTDGDVCTAADHCEAGVCVGSPVVCDDANPCTVDSCDGLGGCSFVAQAAVCDDGDPCTLGDICVAGTCQGSAALTCDDGNPCTDDACGEGGCVHEANATPCDDGNACTTTSACSGGSCVGTEITGCDDGDICTTDACHPTEGCFTTPNTAPCDDGDVCTIGDVCTEGACTAGAKTLTCADGKTCTDDACDATLGCVFVPKEGDCDDQNACTVADTCVNGLCVGSGSSQCDDGTSCTLDICLPAGGCDHQVVAGGCDDGDACTKADTCINGACTSGAPVSCDDGNVCTDEGCVGGDCIFTANEGPCDDGNACTATEACKAGFCSAITMLGCDDGNPCTFDACDPATGCQHTAKDGPCDDGDACTLTASCVEGACVGGVALSCDDGNGCTDDGCQPDAGCVFTPNAAACDDGNACTTDDGCVEGLCSGGGVLSCNDANPCTDDGCDPATGCTVSNNEAGCEDGDACTANDTCVAGVCAGKDGVTCDDANPCTDDSCDPATGCVTSNNNAPCSDGDVCTVGETCSGGNCVAQGLKDCDDGNKCTDDFCDPGQGGCVHTPGDCPCGNNCWSADGCLTQAGRCIRFSCRQGDDGPNFCSDCLGGEWQEISYSQWMNNGYCGDVIKKYRDVEGTATKCAGAPSCCGDSGACNGGDNAWHFWDPPSNSNRYTGPCLGCNGDTNCTYWNGTDNSNYRRITVCEKN